MGATVVDKVTSHMALYREESFGPVVAVIPSQDDDEAVRVATTVNMG